MKIIKRAYGKINLTLEVGQLNQRGLHSINSIMQSIALHDTLTFESRPDSSIELIYEYDDLPYGDDNLIIKAAKLFREVSGVVAGVSITLKKQIPIAAGLGGGSSDAAATLLALNCLWDVEWPIGKLVEISSQLGSDVPFCIIGGTCFVGGIGEKVRPIHSFPKIPLFVVKPDFEVKTKSVYDKFDEMYENYNSQGLSEKMEDAIIKDNDYRKYIVNDLEAVTKKIYPEINDLFKKMKQNFEIVLMSGSGPAIIAFGVNGFINNTYNEIKNQVKFACITNTL